MEMIEESFGPIKMLKAYMFKTEVVGQGTTEHPGRQ